MPTGAFFAGAIAVFDKTEGLAISYIGRDELEACGEAFLAQVRRAGGKTGQGDGGMTTLTQCQQQVLDMLISYQKERGFPPTNQEVATMPGYRSVNAAVEASSRTGEKGVITIKRGVARGDNASYRGEGRRQRGGRIIRALLAGEENARLRATHWLHERDLKV